jgi:hypothetical protein
MKRIVIISILTLVITFFNTPLEAADWETYQLIDRLLTIQEPGEPVIFEDAVIFTASSGYRRVGVAFAHEDFAVVYWFRKLLIPQDPVGAPIPPGSKTSDPYKDSGILFFVYQVPETISLLEYRLIVNGLWVTDPYNPKIRKDPVSGLILSALTIPAAKRDPYPLKGLPQGLYFNFKGPPGETVTVAGDFNNWDPFMYELTESPAGEYSITIPLPPGIYQYVFFNRGQRYPDPYNPKRIYARDGSAASEIIVP